MLGIENLWAFVLAGLLLNMLPGPDSVLIAARGASMGFKAGSAAALGIGSGTLVHILAAALGLSAILATSAAAFTIVKIIGGLYLIYMAITLLRSASASDSATTESFARQSLGHIYRQGLLTNVLNPKVAVFFLAFMPQFISPESDHKALAFVVLGLIFNLNGMLWCHFLAWVSARAGQRVKTSARARAWMNRALAMVFGAFGLRLVMASQN